MDYDDIMGELSTVGEDGGDDVVGALVKGALAAQLAKGGKRPAARRPAWLQGVSMQGVSRPEQELDFLPTNAINFTSTNLNDAAVALPQRPFRGERIVAVATLTDTTTPGAFINASDFVVISPAISVGAVQVGASQGDVPLSTFKADAFGVRLSFPPVGMGARIYIPLVCKVPLTATQTIFCSLTVIGRAVR